MVCRPAADSVAALDALGVDDGAAIARLIELDVEHSLPLAQQHLTIDDGHGDTGRADEHLPDVRLSVHEFVFLDVLGPDIPVVMLVVRVFGDDSFYPAAEVVDEPCFRLVDGDRGGGVRRVNRHLAVADFRSLHNFAHDLSEIDEFFARLGPEVHHFCPDTRRHRQDGEFTNWFTRCFANSSVFHGFPFLGGRQFRHTLKQA